MQQQRYTAAVQFKHKIELYHSRYSKVWACCWQEGTTQVVLKAYFKSKMRARHLENVRRELNILGDLCSLRCNGIVGFLGSFEDKEAIYVVQEHCSCGDLFAAMHKSRGCLSEQWVACQVIAPLLQTLEVVHQRGVIHRDIKPENLFLTQAGVLRVGDWGLAINQLQEKAYSRVGTLDYMAPEVLAMPAPEDLAEGRVRLQDISGYTEAVDVWGVGVLAYELMAGRPPFELSDAQGTADLIMHGQVDNFPMACSAKCISFIKQALMKTPEQRPNATELLCHPWLTAYTNPIPTQASIGPQTPRQTQEVAPSHNHCLGDVPLQHDKLTGTDKPDHHLASFDEAAGNMPPFTHGVHTSAVGLPQGSPQGSWGLDHGGVGMYGDHDWAIQAWAEEPPAALWLSQEEEVAPQLSTGVQQGSSPSGALWTAESLLGLQQSMRNQFAMHFTGNRASPGSPIIDTIPGLALVNGETEQHFTSSHLNDRVDAICDTSGSKFCPVDSAGRGIESVHDGDQVLVGDRACQVKLSAVKSWPTQTTARRDSTHKLPQMDGHISTQVQLHAEGGSSDMTDTCTVQGQTNQPCAMLSASLSGGLLPAQQHEDSGAAAPPPERCIASRVHIGKAPLQWQCSRILGSTDSIAMSQQNAETADLASVSAAMSMVGRMMSAATGCFCT
ncbi:hypothetical protein WJX77_005926 [Trebouxia sp. C0004]